MLPKDKRTEAEAEPSDASVMHPFDRFISAVYARKNDDLFSLEHPAQAGSGTEPRQPSDNGEVSQIGSERLRAQIIARAREAEERAREATERYKQIEAKLRQEQALRRLAEQRAEEVEAEYKQRLSSAQAADLLRLDTELTLAETEVRLKQEAESLRLTETALSRVKEDARTQAQTSAIALEEAENYIAELEARASELQQKAISLEEAEIRVAELENSVREARERGAIAESARAAVKAAEARIAELEVGYREIEDRAAIAESNALAVEAELISTARNLGERTAIAESISIAFEEAKKRIFELESSVREVENKNLVAEETAQEMELLIREAEAREKEAEERFEAAEAGLQLEKELLLSEVEAREKEAEEKFEATRARLELEIGMRIAAERKVQALENKFKSELEMDWTRFTADIEQAEADVKAREKAIAQTSVEEPSREPEDLIQQLRQLHAQLEVERQARGEIERKFEESDVGADDGKTKSKFDAERRLAEMEDALKAANASREQAERKLAEFASGNAEVKVTSRLVDPKPAAPNPSLGAGSVSMIPGFVQAMSKTGKIKLVGYSVAALLLSVALVFLLIQLLVRALAPI